MRLSKDHCLNPTVSTCWWCGGEKNEVILTGAAGEKMAKSMGFKDGKMPMNTIMDMDPCDKCLGHQELGVMFVSVKEDDLEKYAEAQSYNKGLDPNNRHHQNLYKRVIPERTGPMCVLTEEGARKLPIEPPEMLEGIIKKRCCMVPESVYEAFGFPNEDINNLEDDDEI